MKANDKARIISSPYTMFNVGSEYKVSYASDDLIYLVDPFYEGTDEESLAVWPFIEDEVEIV